MPELAKLAQSEIRAHVAAIDQMEAALLERPQIEIQTEHVFAPGVYLRTARMPAGAFVIGAEHKTHHLNILIQGTLRVYVDGKVRTLTAPLIFKSPPGGRKCALILEDVVWMNVFENPTGETDIEKLEAALVEYTPAFKSHMKALNQSHRATLNAGAN